MRDNNNAKLTLKAYNTTIDGPFEVQLGSQLEVKEYDANIINKEIFD